MSDENFQLRATRDLVALCGAERTDSRYAQAIHFCQGYLVGLYHYHQALTAERRQAPVFCIAGPEPTRDQAVASFLTWGRARPQHMDEAPIDGVFRWAVETWPCQRAPRRTRR